MRGPLSTVKIAEVKKNVFRSRWNVCRAVAQLRQTKELGSTRDGYKGKGQVYHTPLKERRRLLISLSWDMSP